MVYQSLAGSCLTGSSLRAQLDAPTNLGLGAYLWAGVYPSPAPRGPTHPRLDTPLLPRGPWELLAWNPLGKRYERPTDLQLLVQMVQTVPLAPETGDDNSCSIKGNIPNYDTETPCFVLLKKGAAQSSEAADLTTRSPVKARVLTGHDSQSIATEEQESCEGREHKQPLTTDQINGTGGTNVFSKSSESVPEESALPHYEHFSMQSKQHRMEGEGQLFQTQDAIHSYKISSQLKKRQRKIHIRICLENVLKCQEKERAESKVLSQLQCEEEQEREFCHWRLDDKKTNAHCSSEQNKERQDNKEGNQQPCSCVMELETLRNALIQLSEEQKEIKRELSKLAKERRLETEISSNCLCLPKEIQMEQQKLNSELQEGKEEGCTEAVPKAKEMEDEMQKLVLQNFLLKATIEKKTKKIE
ncbi:uncharacterized protein RHO17_005445 [Thomomys bottae]